MATLLWPEGILPSTFDWSLSSNGTSFRSPWNGATQTVRFPGSAWEASMTLRNLDDFESRAVEVMIFELDGLAGRIQLWDFGRDPVPKIGNPLVMGSSQTGSTVNTDGWPNSTRVLKKGDYVTINNELKMILSDVVSDSTGKASLRIGPMLRNSPPDNAPVIMDRPYGIFRLNKTKNGVSREPMNNNFTLEFVEAF